LRVAGETARALAACGSVGDAFGINFTYAPHHVNTYSVASSKTMTEMLFLRFEIKALGQWKYFESLIAWRRHMQYSRYAV
jgi:hypothetical protein